MNGDSRSTWPNAELHKEIAELRSQLATRAAELENIEFLSEQAEICHQAELAEARNSTPSWIQDHTIEIVKLKAELAEAQRENAGCWCKLTGQKILKERDELRTQLTESRSKHLHDVLAEQMLNQELRTRLDAAENDRKRLDWCETNLIITYPSRKAKTFREAVDAAMSAEATEQVAPSTPQETHTPGA